MGDAPAGHQGPFEEVGGLEIGVDRLGPLGGLEGIGEGLGVALGMEVVEGEELGLLVASGRGGGQDRVAGPVVQLAPEPEREPVVGRVPEESVTEPDGVVVPGDEVLQPLPGGVVRLG